MVTQLPLAQALITGLPKAPQFLVGDFQAVLEQAAPYLNISLAFPSSAAVLGFSGAARFARAATAARVLRAAGLVVVPTLRYHAFFLLVGITPACVLFAFPFLGRIHPLGGCHG